MCHFLLCYMLCYYMQTIFYEQAHEQNMVLNTRKLLNSYIFKPPCNFCIIFVGSRAWACRSLCRRRWNISLHKKIDGTSLLTSFRDTLSIHKTAVASYYQSADGVGKLHRLQVDFQHHLPAQRLECARSSHHGTNNDIEGWHNGLNRRAGGRVHIPFYLLVQQLHREAKLSVVQVRLVSDGKLKRIQRKIYRRLQTKIFDL